LASCSPVHIFSLLISQDLGCSGFGDRSQFSDQERWSTCSFLEFVPRARGLTYFCSGLLLLSQLGVSFRGAGLSAAQTRPFRCWFSLCSFLLLVQFPSHVLVSATALHFAAVSFRHASSVGITDMCRYGDTDTGIHRQHKRLKTPILQYAGYF
jgi:hypothetical protein